MFDFDSGCDLGLLCRDDRCPLDELHIVHEIDPLDALAYREHTRRALRTKSRRWRTQPWRANCLPALREAVLRGVSYVEPRNFATVLAYVENDYGACRDRSVHRHLKHFRASGEIVRLDFPGKVHAYLRAGSRLISEPGLVLEQILDLHASEAYA